MTAMNCGGAETMVMNYYRKIDRKKVQFDFLLHRPEHGDYDDEIEALGGRIYRIPAITNTSAHIKAVKRFFNENKNYSIIHGHVGELGLFIYKESERCLIPCIIAHAHNASCDLDWKWPVRWLLKHLIRKHISTPMTCSRDAARWLFGKKLAMRAVMLNNAIDAREYSFSPERRVLIRAKMGWQDQYVIGNVARFSPQKNHLFLIRLFAYIAKERDNARLVLAGAKTGDLFAQVRALAHKLGIADKVEFLGLREDIADLLQGMDAYCCPSFYEGLSLSMVEAQAAGLHVITSDRVPRQVLLVPGLMQFLPLSAGVEAWSQAILSPYERRDTFQDICQAGFDIQQNAQWLQDFYLKQAQK